jgi:hypothetical protein
VATHQRFNVGFGVLALNPYIYPGLEAFFAVDAEF